MTAAQFDGARQTGKDEAQRAAAHGDRLLIAGDVGIDNTTAVACFTALLTGTPAEGTVGRGAGSDDAVLSIKRLIVVAAVNAAREVLPRDVLAAIASVAGFEIGTMTGFYAAAAAAAAGATLLLDGYVATSAAMIAERLVPGTATQIIEAHRSAEPGHGAALDALGREPVLDWQMRLGEGTGALVALPLLGSAAALLTGVALLADVGADG